MDGAKLCPICKVNSIGKNNTSCDNCASFTCQLCSKQARGTVYRLPSTKIPEEYVTLRVMGWGVSGGECLDCGSQYDIGDALMGDKHVCLKCAKKRVAPGLLVCFSCFHGQCARCHEESDILNEYAVCPKCTKKESYISSKTGICRRCNEYKRINESNVCEGCFVEEELEDQLCEYCKKPTDKFCCDDCKSKLRRCGVCKSHFIPKNAFQILCDGHRGECLSCFSTFDTNDKTEVYCPTCKTQIHLGICIGCKERTGVLNIYGRCEQCEPTGDTTSERHFCGVCHVNEINYPGQICKYCTNNKIKCPLCMTNTIPAKQYICNSCAVK